MKKLIAFVLVLITLAIAFASCAGENTPEATTYNYYTSKITPAATTATTAVITEPASTSAEQTVSTTATKAIIDPLTLPIEGEYTILREQIKLKTMAVVPQTLRARDDDEYTYDRSVKVKFGLTKYKPSDFRIVTVVGYAGEANSLNNIRCSNYYVCIEKYGEGLTDATVYKMRVFGAPDEMIYGQERIEIGDRFLTVGSVNEKSKTVDTVFSLFARIGKVGGVEYVYSPMNVYDFPRLKCAEHITDKEENSIYKKGLDDDVIAYIDANKMPRPTYDYKCKLDAFVDEVCNYTSVKVSDIVPVGEYTSIREQVPFESFAEFPEDMRLDAKHPYLPKETNDMRKYIKEQSGYSLVTVAIAGYIGEEIGDDGMVYSYYYVYVDIDTERYVCRDDTVYVMKAYGSPAHPYYGQRRYEIGDVFLRLETDVEYIRSEEKTLDATSLFWVDSKTGRLGLTFPDFNTDFSTIISFKGAPMYAGEEKIYSEKYDTAVYDYMNEKGIDVPIYEYFLPYANIIGIL